MKRVSLLGLMLATLSGGSLVGQQPEQTNGQLHVVNEGDTLWDLAGRYLGDPYLWTEIFARNRELIQDPDWIYPQQRIFIPGLAPATADGGAPSPPSPAGRTVFFQEDRQTRAGMTLRLAAMQDEIPVVEPGAFYAAGLLTPDSLRMVARLEEVISPTVLPRETAPQIQLYDRVLMSVHGSVQVGERLHLLRPERVIAEHGRIYQPTGIARVLALTGGTATAEVERLYEEVRPGDIALPMPPFGVPAGIRPAPATGVEGTILAFALDQPVVAREDVAYLDLGRAAGVAEGDEFVAYLPESIASWGTRPPVDVARLQVVRAGESTSAVRVVSLEQPALRVGLPVRLVAKMP